MTNPFEKPPTKMERKEISDKELIGALKAGVFENPEAREVLRRWAEQEHNKVANNPRAMIEFNLKMARLYLETGYGQESFEMFEDARRQARNERNEELYAQISAEMDEIENRAR